MRPVRLEGGDLSRVLAPGGLTFVQGASAESALWPDELERTPDAWGEMTFTGLFFPGLNRRCYLPGAQTRMQAFFMTPELRAAGERVEFLPICYTDIQRRLRDKPIAAALFRVTPPDEEGLCSFGPVVDFLAEIWPQIPVRIAQIDPLLPRTHGHPGIPFEALTAVIERSDGPIVSPSPAPDAISDAIGRHVAEWIGDGSTIEIGLGRVPGAILRALDAHRDLRLHSGLVSDDILRLRDCGALASENPITAGVAIGDRALYAAIGEPDFQFAPVSITHSAAVLAKLKNFVAINSALEVDLFGQGYAEFTPGGWMSGPGGATDFARGARLGGGLSIVALPSQAKGMSRIIAPGDARGPVSMGRFDIDLVATEHGVADLRGWTHDERAAALIAIAHPDDRDALTKSWRALQARF